ncbi:hypothetical protein PR048_011671 [Dryococelus australis]|uniref:DDE Tnp4 domain-containing protein n=1 Tax=Dryococelus australis TaxID=614101 RepID=A0ABQ9HMV6_9NEOP|nr:hypothetical protein PR048_011671 [Dryococelus australis]
MKGALLLPAPALLPPSEDPILYIFVGDEAFTLSENLMRPCPKPPVDIKVNSVFCVVKAACVWHNYLRHSPVTHSDDDPVEDRP